MELTLLPAASDTEPSCTTAAADVFVGDPLVDDAMVASGRISNGETARGGSSCSGAARYILLAILQSPYKIYRVALIRATLASVHA